MQENMDLMKSFHTAAALLPERLWRAAYSLSEEQRAQCEELRVRLDRPLAATVAGKTVRLGKEPVLPVKAELDELLARATARVQPPSDKGRRLKIFYMTQAGIQPPTFVCFCNDSRLFHFSYVRYLENQIRQAYPLEGTPVKMVIRQRGEEL